MTKQVRVIVLLALCAAVPLFVLSCAESPPPTLVLAPPGPADLGPATNLPTPPPEAICFELNYRPQTGAAEDIQYHSYWGFGGSTDEVKANSFLQDVRQKHSHLYYVQNPSFKGREWAAVEYGRGQAWALYFDVNADGKLADNERIPPSRKTHYGLEFITPDFVNPLQQGGHTLCRALLQVNFYGRSAEPNCMWSPAAVLEGSAQLNGQTTRLLLFVSRPGGEFDNFGFSHYSLFPDQTRFETSQYIPRETLSSLISCESQFYHLTIEGRRSNGLPARMLLTKDSSPIGTLAVKLTGSNALRATLSSLYLHGVDDNTVFLRVDTARSNAVSLPVGTYALSSGTASYGTTGAPDWEVGFTDGPSGTVKAGEVVELALGQPRLQIRAVEERNRYNRLEPGSAAFKPGTLIYLEPQVVGREKEVFSRFRQSTVAKSDKTDRPPKVTITGPDGKRLLAQTMEYG